MEGQKQTGGEIGERENMGVGLTGTGWHWPNC